MDYLQSAQAGAASCLVLDVRMPGMDGLSLQRRLAETGQTVPIVFLSARASEEERRAALAAGASSFLHKPVGKEALLQAIRTALEESPAASQ